MGCTLLLLVVIRWEEERSTDGSKWRFLEHKGPVFAAPYEPMPDKVKFYYDGEYILVKKKRVMFLFLFHFTPQCDCSVFVGKPMKLNAPAKEVATFFAKMLDHEYTTKDIFRKNFLKDWRKVRR